MSEVKKKKFSVNTNYGNECKAKHTQPRKKNGNF